MRINKIFADAEAVCTVIYVVVHIFVLQITATTVFETLLGCLTCYASYALTKSSYSKKLDELQEFLDRENKEIYHRVGFHLRNPMERGLRVVSFYFPYKYQRKRFSARNISVKPTRRNS